MVVCAGCGVANEPGRKFCRECGTRLALTCPACGTAQQPDDKFCGECGAPLVVGAAPVMRPASGTRAGNAVDATERRLVSVLFVDLVGFTSYSEGRDGEDVRAMLSRYFDAATDAVSRHGGSVEKFIGDAVMAVWGTPVAHEDDAERAVRSAIEIVDRVAVLGAEIGVPLQARAGVLTGEAVAALDAVDQGFVTGDLVNTASRLQSAAEPGSVLVGEGTYRSTSEAIAYQPVDPLTLKGKSDQVAAWKVLRVLGERGGSGRGNAPEPPFVGREDELRLVKELLHGTAREGRPRLIHVTGVGGIGKSRLVWELLKYVDGLTEDVFWHLGRCPSYGDGVSFWALAEMVRSRAGIADTDDEPLARAKLAVCLDRFVTDAEERAWLEPRLGHLLGLDPAPSGGRDELFGSWRRFFELVAANGTTVLVVEELHWADPGLMDFLESVLEWSRTSPILVLTLGRPELTDRRPSWGVGVRNATTVHVDPLRDEQMALMLHGFVDGLPDAAVAELVRRAEGVPLYAVETVRMLVDRGVLVQRDEHYEVVGDAGLALADLDVPESLHALVAARLDALPEAERWLVQDASVAGHSFTLSTVCAVTGREPQDVEPSLRSLVRKEVLDQDADPRSPERGSYLFVQSVIREVAYSTLSKGARRTKHLACARWFEAQGEEDLAGVVASHYLDAYRADPSANDAEEIAARAREWVRRAAERALTLGSPEQALGFTQQALELTDDPAQRAALYIAAASARRVFSADASSWPEFQEAARIYRGLDDVVGEAEVYIEAGRLDLGTDHSTITARMIELLDLLGDSHVRQSALLSSTLADRYNALGHREAGLEMSERAIVLAQAQYDDEVLRRAAATRVWSLASVGRQFESRVLQQAVVDLARQLGSSSELASTLLRASTVVSSDDPMAAIELASESLELSERIGNRPSVELNLSNLIEALINTAQWDRADAALARLDALERVEPAFELGAQLGGIELRAHRGDSTGAVAELARIAPDIDDETVQLQIRTWFLRVRATTHLLAGDAVAALADARTSLRLDPVGANAGPSLWVGVQAACLLRSAEALRELLDVTAGMRGRWVETVRRLGAAALAALAAEAEAEGESGAAAHAVAGRQLHDVLQAWLDLDLRLDHAWTVLCAAQVLGRDAVAPEHLHRARTLVESLGAESLRRRFDDAGI